MIASAIEQAARLGHEGMACGLRERGHHPG
jgi:hypothetical protein